MCKCTLFCCQRNYSLVSLSPLARMARCYGIRMEGERQAWLSAALVVLLGLFVCI
jgi:hypothetical protein